MKKVELDKLPTEKEIQKGVAAALLQKVEPISVDIKPKNWLHKTLQKWGVCRKQEVYKISPATYSTLMQCLPLLVDISFADKPEAGEGQLDWAYVTALENGEKLKKVICYGINNKRGEYSMHLERFVEDNFESEDFKIVAMIVIAKLNVMTFSNTISLIRGMNPLKTMKETLSPELSPQEPVETIARGEQLETLANIFAGAKIV